MPKHNPKRDHLLPLALFSLLTLALSWPLPLRVFGWVPGAPQWAFDESTFVWNIWYFKRALIDNLSSPLHSELIYYPLGIDLILYTYNFFNALLAQPLHLAVGLVFASNVTVWLSTALSGYGTFLLVRYLLSGTRHWERRTSQYPIPNTQYLLPSLFAGLVYAFASNRALYMTLGHYDMATTQWIPFYALTLLRSLDGQRTQQQRRRDAILAGVFFAFNGLAEMITAVFLAIFTIIVVVVKVLTQRRRAAQEKSEGESESVGSPETARPAYAKRNTQSPPYRAVSSLAVTLYSLLLVGLTAFILWSPVLVPILTQFLTDDFSLKGWGEAIPLSTDLLGWFTPTVLHPLFGGDLVAELRRVQLKALSGADVPGFRDVNTVFIGWATGALALLGALIYRRRVAVWSWTALIFGLFTLGPFLQINGQYRFDLDGVETSFPLPYALLHYIPIVKANRAPNRNSVLLMLGVAVLVGYAIYWLLGIGYARWRARNTHYPVPITQFLSILLIGLVLFEHLALPLPLSDHRVPAVYAEIAADPAPVAVMHAPLGWRNSFGVFGAERTRLQYFQSVHQKPMLGGNISRAPDFKMDYFRRIPLFQAIRQAEFTGDVPLELAQAAAAQAEELMYLYNVGYVLLMPPIPQRFPYADHWQATWDFYRATLPLAQQPFWTGPAAEGGTIEAYRVEQPAGSDNFTLALGEGGTFPYRGEGWDTAEADTPYGQPGVWATAQESCVFLPLRGVEPTAEYTLRAAVRPFSYPGGGEQRVALRVNGETLPGQPLIDDWQTAEWTVPGTALRSTLNRLCFEWAYAAVPREVLGGSRIIGGTGVELPLDTELKSFADGAFIALFDEETGAQRDASAGRRGVNVTVLEPESGEIVDRQGFDTAANEFESQRLAQFLAQIPAGHPVLVASRGDAGAFLTEEAVAGLGSLGADLSQEALQGQFLALIGVKGAAPGTALQSIAAPEAFLRLGLNPDRRALAAAVGKIEIVKAGE